MLDQDRRRAERLLLPSPIAGRMADRDVRIVDIGILGTRIEHDEPLMVGPHTLRFAWDGEEIEVDCTRRPQRARGRPRFTADCSSAIAIASWSDASSPRSPIATRWSGCARSSKRRS